jgi:hypothetical protein
VDKATLEMKTLPELEWNFDSVPGNELVACCYWEYAHESAFICELRQRCWEHWQPLYLKGQWWNEPEDKKIHGDLQKVQSIGYPAEVFLRGISCPPDGVLPDALPLKPGEVYRTTGSFPKPWQELTKEARAYRAHIGSDVERIPLVPFERGISMYAQDILDWVKTQRTKADAGREQVRREHPKLNEETLLRLGKLKFPEIKPSVYWAGGKEVTIVAIDWGSFTNDEIVNYFRRWVKVNRPQQYPVPSLKGHKPGDWRANLTRLAAMRLLSQFSALQIVRQDSFPAIWETKQFSGRKWGDFTKWRDARREAGKLFRKLFPFLPKDEKPISWERQTPDK